MEPPANQIYKLSHSEEGLRQIYTQNKNNSLDLQLLCQYGLMDTTEPKA